MFYSTFYNTNVCKVPRDLTVSPQPQPKYMRIFFPLVFTQTSYARVIQETDTERLND